MGSIYHAQNRSQIMRNLSENLDQTQCGRKYLETQGSSSEFSFETDFMLLNLKTHRMLSIELKFYTITLALDIVRVILKTSEYFDTFIRRIDIQQANYL